MQPEPIPTPEGSKPSKEPSKEKKIKRLFEEFVETPTHKGLKRVMRRANRVIARTVPQVGGSVSARRNADQSWLKAQFAVWKSVSLSTPREEIIRNFKDIAYHLKSIAYLSQHGLSYSGEERRLYSEVLCYYTCILSIIFIPKEVATSDNAVAPATSDVAVAPATSDIAVAPATSDIAVAPATSERVVSSPIQIPPPREHRRPCITINVDSYSPRYIVDDGCTGRTTGFGGHQCEWDIG